MKKLKFIIPICIIIAAGAVFFARRANSGKNVKNITADTPQVHVEADTPVEQALAEAPDALKGTYDNLILPDEVYKFANGEVTQLYNITAQTSVAEQNKDKEDLIEKVKSYMQSMLGDDIEIEIDDGNYDLFDEMIGTAGDYICTAGTYGFTVFLNSNENNALNGVRNDIYRMDCGENVDEVSLSNGYTANEAIARADEYIQEYLMDDEYSDELCAKTLMVVDCPDGTQAFVIRYEHVTDGVAYNDLMGMCHQSSGFFRENYTDLIINDDTSPVQLMQFGSMKIVNKEPIEENQIISLQNALDTASEYLAPYGVYMVSDIKLKYCCVRKLPDSDEVEAYNRAQFTYRPMWCLVVKTGEPVNPPSDTDLRMEIIIDAQNGTVYLYDGVDKTGPYFTVE